MPAPIDYTVAQPQVSSYFEAIRQGRADRQAVEGERRKNALSKYLPGALEGDEGMRKQALAAAADDPDRMIALNNAFQGMDARQLQETKEKQGRLASLAAWADTPEKWAIANQEAKKIFPNAPDLPFEQREMVIAKAQTLAEQIDQAHKAKSLALDAERTKAQNAASYASADASRANADYIRAGRGKMGPQLPQKGQTYENEGLEKIQIASNNNADVQGIIEQIDGGQLDPGLLSNKYSEAKSFFGAVDPNDQNTRNYNSFITTMERLRNESLRLNKGVQTDSDAKRAWAELFKNVNDKTVVRDQLARIAKLNERAARQHAGLVRNNRKNYLGDRYEDPDWELLGIDPSLVSNDRPAAAPTSFVRGGAGIFSDDAPRAVGRPGAPRVQPVQQNTTGSGGGLREGQTGTSKSGRPMVVRNGQWEYQ